MVKQTAEKRLYRSRDAYVAGVCSGIADYYDFDHIVVRILAILLVGLTLGLAAIAYVILWIRMPLEPELPAPYDVMPESAESSAYGCVDCFPHDFDVERSDRHDGLPIIARLAVAAGLMLLFLAVALNLSPLVPGTQWWQFWPLGCLICGLCLIVIPVRSRFESAWHAAGIVVTSLAACVLPMSLGVVSWKTITCSLELLWPVLLVAAALFCAGLYRQVDALVLAGAFCVVAFCLLGSVFCILPGELEMLMFYAPGGHSVQLGFPR